MGLLEEILAEIADIGVDAISEQSKSEKARKDRLSKNSKEAEKFFQKLGQHYKNKDNLKYRKSSKANIQRKSPSDSKTPIESTMEKNVEEIPLEERLKRYKQIRSNEENKSLQRNENVQLTFKNLEKNISTKKYKQILKSRKGAKDAFIYSTIFERKV